MLGFQIACPPPKKWGLTFYAAKLGYYFKRKTLTIYRHHYNIKVGYFILKNGGKEKEVEGWEGGVRG